MASRAPFMFYCVFLVLFSAVSFVLAETGCPPAETIEPCICDGTGSPRLICSSILRPTTLEEVFRNAARYTFQEVHIRSSSLMYIPSVIFQEARINELYVEESTFVSLFEAPLNTTTLEKLQLVNTTMQRGFLSSLNLKQVTNLKTLILEGVPVTALSSSFGAVFPESLKQIILKGTGLKKIAPGALDAFPSLDKLEVSSSRLKNLTRNIFPRPFNARFLYLDNNNISHIPSDLFTDMPELQFVSMKNNSITEVPEAAFGFRDATIPYLRLDENPLQCNCLLVWLVKNKPEIVGGTCHAPRNLMGKELKDLKPGDFNCF